MPFAIAGAGVGAVGSIVGGGKQADATKKAAQMQLQAATQAQQLQQSEFDKIQQNEAPYLQAGSNALTELNQRMPEFTAGFDPTKAGIPSQFSYSASDMQNDPAYQFAMQQGQQAIQRSAAANGNVLGGATLKSLDQFAQGTANQFYGQDYTRAQQTYQQNYGNAFDTFTSNQQNAFNKLAGVASLGAGANGQVQNAGTNFANQSSAIAEGAGNAQSAGVIGQANAQASELGGLSSSLTGLMNNGSFQDMMKKYSGSGRSGSNSSYQVDNFN